MNDGNLSKKIQANFIRGEKDITGCVHVFLSLCVCVCVSPT